jgi:predicted O-linked N-acetylglucosamine transferase (SPINDLY family)
MELGVARRLFEVGRAEHGQQIVDDILAIHDSRSDIWNDIGTLLLMYGRHKESETYFRRAIELDPRSAAAWSNLGSSYLARNEMENAVAAFRESLKHQPGAMHPLISMLRPLRYLMRYEEAQIYARSALDLLDVPHVMVPSEGRIMLLQLLKCMCDFEGLDRLGDVWAASDNVLPAGLSAVFLDYLVFAESKDDIQRFLGHIKRWADYHQGIVAQTPLPPRVVQAAKPRLRVGLLSSDLRSHSVSRFIKPLFEGYDRERIELHCYSPLRVEGDAVERKLAAQATSFKYIDGLTDREAAEMIRNDDIDILIELNGFTQFTRLPVMAYKPAPVQMSWLGYPFTCGLKEIDYVILDRFVAPRDETTLVEEALIMPDAWVCFGKFADTPIDPTLPMDRNGVVTFGTLNNPYKFNRNNIALWSRVMREVPNSRFLIVRPEIQSVSLVANIAKEFAKHGISSDRIYLRSNRLEKRDHLSYYNEIDISLDSFPLTGGTTTCEATWMGVPVVTYVGDAFHQRISYSALMQCGLEELCTFSHDDFVARAVKLAGEREKLAAWRTGLRDIMLASPLCDEQRFLFQFQDMLEQVARLHGLR